MPKATQPTRFTTRDPPVARGRARCRDGEHREAARDEEADRAARVRRPHEPVVLVRVESPAKRVEGRHVEEEGADELGRVAPPVEAARPEQAALDVLQRRRRREEDRADEEHGGVDRPTPRAPRGRAGGRPGSTRSRWRRGRRSTTCGVAEPTSVGATASVQHPWPHQSSQSNGPGRAAAAVSCRLAFNARSDSSYRNHG